MKKTILAAAIAALFSAPALAIDLTFWGGGAQVGAESSAQSGSGSAILTAGPALAVNGGAGFAVAGSQSGAELGSDGVEVTTTSGAANQNVTGAFSLGNALTATVGGSEGEAAAAGVGTWGGFGVGISPTSP